MSVPVRVLGKEVTCYYPCISSSLKNVKIKIHKYSAGHITTVYQYNMHSKKYINVVQFLKSNITGNTSQIF